RRRAGGPQGDGAPARAARRRRFYQGILRQTRRPEVTAAICLFAKRGLALCVLNFWGEGEDILGRPAERGLPAALFFSGPAARQTPHINSFLPALNPMVPGRSNSRLDGFWSSMARNTRMVSSRLLPRHATLMTSSASAANDNPSVSATQRA